MAVSYFTKAYFAHDRPLSFFKKLDMADKLTFVDGVQLHTGATSFPSGHAMAAFALYGLVSFLLPGKKWQAVLLFSVAFLVALSRVYLVQHFWQDVFTGAIIGLAIAMLVFLANERAGRRAV
jgi:membrane-associated phospholipid phosphatase